MLQRARGFTTVAVAALASLALVAPAQAAPDSPAPKPRATAPTHPDAGKPYPSKAEVDRARAEVERRAADLDRIHEVIAAAGSRASTAYVTAEVAAERYNGARWELAEARKAARQAVHEARVARHRVEVQRIGIANLAAQSYQDGSALRGITVFMSGGPPSEIMQRQGVAESAGSALKIKYDEFAETSRIAEEAEEAAERARKKARELSEQATTAKSLASYATVAAAQAQSRVGGTQARLQAKYDEAQQRFTELAEDRQDALRRLHDRNGANDPGPERPLPPAPKKDPKPRIHHGVADDTSMIIPKIYPGPVPNPPAPDRAAAERAIAFAKEQVGDMYLWAAVGPDRWDCSGLTMAAWRRGGTPLPHYSEAQYLISTPISAADLQPGDLVFWQGAQERIHHVALYIGDGRIIHAERTGEPVKIVAIEDFTPPDFFGRPQR